jgi:polyisoprenoid-binding protein YceI
MRSLPAGVWTVDRRHSEIGFAVKDMWGLRTVRGVFGEYEGSLMVRAGSVTGELTIEAGSVDTGNRRRDRHLCSGAFFDIERYPQVQFSATAVTPDESGSTFMGVLAIGSSRARIEVPVNVERTADGTLRVEGETAVSRQSAGLGWNMLGMIRGDAVLHARLTLNPQSSDDA